MEVIALPSSSSSFSGCLRARKLSSPEVLLVQSYSSLNPPKNEEEEMEKELKAFLENPSQQILNFSPSLDASQRKMVHEIAELMGLEHISQGKGANRHIVVQKKDDSTLAPLSPSSSSISASSASSSSISVIVSSLKSLSLSPCLSPPSPSSPSPSSSSEIVENLKFKGYIALEGLLIDSIASWDNISAFHTTPSPSPSSSVKDIIPSQYYLQRVSRDGVRHHLTLLSRMELQQVLENATSLPQEIFPSSPTPSLAPSSPSSNTSSTSASSPSFVSLSISAKDILHAAELRLEDDWSDLGVGRLEDKENDNEVYYRIVNWPSGARFRKCLGLPNKDFHITLGFKKSDIHHLPKDISTLIYNNSS